MPIKLSIETHTRAGFPAAKITGFPETLDPPFIGLRAKYLASGKMWGVRAKEHEIIAESAEDLQSAIADFQKKADQLNFLEGQRERIRQRLLTSKLLGEIEDKVVEIEYDGYGDSGEISEATFEDKDAPDGDDFTEFLWNVMWERNAGFENNEGGCGTVSWDLVKDEITIDHGTNYTETRYEKTVV